MTELLVNLVEAESPTIDPTTQFGPQDILRAEFETLGYEVRRLGGHDGRDGGRLLVRPPPFGPALDFIQFGMAYASGGHPNKYLARHG